MVTCATCGKSVWAVITSVKEQRCTCMWCGRLEFNLFEKAWPVQVEEALAEEAKPKTSRKREVKG